MKLSERTALLTIAAVVVVAVGLVWFSTPAPTLPPKVQAAVDRHVQASAVDTSVVHRLERDTAAIAKVQRIAASEQRHLEAVATTEKNRADSLAGVAAAAETARDSAMAYHAALDASRARGDTLQKALGQATTELQASAAHVAVSDSIAAVWKRHAFRGDTVISQLLPLALHRDSCRILWVLGCPSRKQSAVAGTVAGVLAAAVAGGKIQLPVRLR